MAEVLMRRRRRAWVPRVAGFACLLIGLVNIGSATTHALRGRMRELLHFVPGTLTDAATAATLVAGILLIMLAAALRRRKRRAWRAVVGLLAASVVLHVVKGLDVEEATGAAVLLLCLLGYRNEFYARGDPRTRWLALRVFLVLTGLSVALGLMLVQNRSHALVGDPPFGDRLQHVLLGLVGITGPLRFRGDRLADLVGFSLTAMGLLTALTTTYLALRPAQPPGQLSPEDEARMRDLLARHGHRDSLGYFALRRDKSVIWSPTGKSCVSYRVVSGVMLATGDPLGDPEAWPGAIDRFLDLADQHAWVPAVMGCSEQGGQVWCREGGLDALELGDEAIVEVADFTLQGRAMRNVRQMIGRVERLGYTCQVRRLRDVPVAERQQIEGKIRGWRNGETERGFSMALGRFGDPADAECVLVTAHKDGEVRALLHFVPWGRDGLSLDLMRRDRAADPGLNELLIVAALRNAPALGVRQVSLNFAVFRSALERGERLGAGPVLRTWRAVLLFLSRWFQIESLYRFNAKFRPVWEPRFVVFPATRDLPRIGIAALEAEAFIVRPQLRRLKGAPRPAAAPAPVGAAPYGASPERGEVSSPSSRP